MAPLFAGKPRDVTEENIQSRARGTILMAISNKFGFMVLTTGNKSEMSVGYATLYGDMNGGFNPIKDVYKTQVFRLCRLRNSWKPELRWARRRVIPESILVRPPTAELRENQNDQDTLPPYEVLDDILQAAGGTEECRSPTSCGAASTEATVMQASSTCSTSPNTSGGRRRRASR